MTDGDMLEKNLEVIGKKDYGLAMALRRPELNGVEIEEARSGAFTFRYEGRWFHSRYDPEREAEGQLKAIEGRKFDWVLLFGLGCGYLLRALLRSGHRKIIVYEPSMEILKGVLEKADLRKEFSEEKVFLCTDFGRLAETIRGHVDGMDDLLGYHLPPYKQVFRAELAEYLKRVENAQITLKVGIVTEISSRLDWVENYFSNIGNFVRYPPVNALEGRLKGVPCVVVGAGPSLAKNVDLLGELRDRVLIIAAVTAYRVLVNHGVVPHFVIAAEKYDMPEYFTGGVTDEQIRLILGEVTHPNMFARAAKGKFVYFNPYLSLSILQAGFWGCDYLAASGGSVSTAATDMGVMFGCNPIIFVGQDLSFADGKTHADGGVYQSQEVSIDGEKGEVSLSWNYPTLEGRDGTSHTLLWLKGLDGRPVPSKYDWVTFHQWFEHYMAHMARERPEVKMINATEGGAYIEGMDHMKLAEAADRYIGGAAEIETAIDEAGRTRPPIDFDALEDSFREMLRSLRVIDRLARSIGDEAAAAEKKLNASGLTLDLRGNVTAMKKFEKRLLKRASRLPFMWEALAAYTYKLKEFLRAERDDDELEDFRKNLEATALSYGEVSGVCERFIPRVEEAVAIIDRARREAAAQG
ncbi:MAG TPA: DUF115 domain-containing protein [Deltaproteobacteria bacterium]|nr:DUF115 domain-containing protein [Deltaproteobacteria bacterium]